MKLRVRNFDLKETVEGGQIFNYAHENGWYFIIHRGSVIKVRQPSSREIEFRVFPRENDAPNKVPALFQLGKNYFPIIRKYFQKREIRSSYEKFPGVRITQLDPWECMLGFLCSQMNNIPRIRRMVRCLSEKRGGKAIAFGGRTFFPFPPPEALAGLKGADLAECRLGYRASYILSAARAVQGGFDLGKLRRLDYARAKRALMMLPGVGEKVADCILLFSLGFTECFPVDVWIRKIMQNLYFGGKSVSEKKIAEFARKKFGKDAAIVHEYLYANRHALA